MFVDMSPFTIAKAVPNWSAGKWPCVRPQRQYESLLPHLAESYLSLDRPAGSSLGSHQLAIGRLHFWPPGASPMPQQTTTCADIVNGWSHVQRTAVHGPGGRTNHSQLLFTDQAACFVRVSQRGWRALVAYSIRLLDLFNGLWHLAMYTCTAQQREQRPSSSWLHTPPQTHRCIIACEFSTKPQAGSPPGTVPCRNPGAIPCH